MYWQKNIGRVRFGVCLIITGVILFVVGLFVQQYHEFSSTPEGYIRDVSYPFYPVGIGLIVVSGVLFIIGFYCIVKDKIPL
jgi:uncharacterized membrane protein